MSDIAKPEHKARKRVQHNRKLGQHESTIFYDWPNWDEHMKWIATASVSEILDWAETVESQVE